MLQILKQRIGKICKGKNGQGRIFLQDGILKKLNLEPGNLYETLVKKKGEIVLKATNKPEGNVVSKKVIKGEEVPVIDKENYTIREALEGYEKIKITFLLDDNEGRVVIEGIKTTASAIKETIPEPTEDVTNKKIEFSCIDFCSGAGVSSSVEDMIGFKSRAFCDYNPKAGAEDKFAKIYQANHPDSIMFNIPMQDLTADCLPNVDLWAATLDCSDFSKLASGKKEYQTMHLFIHLMRLFYEKKKEDRPKAILIENSPSFIHVAGNSIKLSLEEEGYHVTMGKLNSLDYSSRTKRERFFMVASIYEGYTFPDHTGRLTTPIIEDGVITLDNLNWVTPETNKYIEYYTEREKKDMSHNHRMTLFDICENTHIGTITKSHVNSICENIIKHPTKENTYAFITDPKHLRYLHSIDKGYYLGDSDYEQIQAIGQGVCCKTFYHIVKKLYDHLLENIFKKKEEPRGSVINDIKIEKITGDQISLFSF